MTGWSGGFAVRSGCRHIRGRPFARRADERSLAEVRNESRRPVMGRLAGGRERHPITAGRCRAPDAAVLPGDGNPSSHPHPVRRTHYSTGRQIGPLHEQERPNRRPFPRDTLPDVTRWDALAGILPTSRAVTSARHEPDRTPDHDGGNRRQHPTLAKPRAVARTVRTSGSKSRLSGKLPRCGTIASAGRPIRPPSNTDGRADDHGRTATTYPSTAPRATCGNPWLTFRSRPGAPET